jgi:hypothetical protein
MSLSIVAQMTIVRPFILGFVELIVFFMNTYVALAYGKSVYQSPTIVLMRHLQAFSVFSLPHSMLSSRNTTISILDKTAWLLW